MRSILIALFAVAALALVGCAGNCGGVAAGSSATPVMEVNLPSVDIPAPIWFRADPAKPTFVPSGYTQVVQPAAAACAPAPQAKPVPQAPAWVPAPAAAPLCP
jgi:hypothetical protein